MKHLVATACVGLLLAVSTSQGAAPERKLYKWVDNQGVTHYGDRIPPEYASQEQHIMNAQGVEIDRLEAQKTPEQLAAEEQKRREQTERESRDKNLLSTYSSVQEIERLRDQRLALLADQIRVTAQFLENLDARMKKLRATSAGFKPYSADPHAPPMSDQVAEDLVRVAIDMRTQEENLHEKQSEEATTRKQFESDIARFKELKGIH